MLNTAEHEILNAHKYKNIKKFGFFSGSDKPRMLYFLLLSVKRKKESERKKKKRQTEEEVGRQYQRVDRNGLCQIN